VREEIMRRLRLVGLSGDGRDVVFVDEANSECAAPADDRLRAALRGDRARLGQLEIEMESVLRPRDIQARIRAGQTPESVAALAQVSVDKIMAYCVPVLAEREHIATKAGRGFVRRPSSDGSTRKLTDVVAEKLRGRGLDPSTAEWDAWRRDDGRWSVQASYQSGGRAHSATFVYDAVGRYSIAEDDEAKWLTGEKQLTRKGPQPREAAVKAAEPAAETEPQAPAARRLAAVPTGDDLLSLSLEAEAQSAAPADVEPVEDNEVGPADVISREADEPEYEEEFVDTSDDLTAVVRAVRETVAEESREMSAPAEPEVVDVAESESIEAEPEAPVVQQREERQRRRPARRASVPSWDEIMFGRGADR
jgi:hypothetical protein